LESRPINQANDTGMRLISDDRKFSKVFIESHKNTPLLMGAGKNFVIAWINIPNSSPDDVMSRGFERFNGTTPRYTYLAGVSRRCFDGERLNSFVTNEPVGIGQAGLDIRWFQPRIPLKNGFRRITGC
jgi:hypothetical protein